VFNHTRRSLCLLVVFSIAVMLLPASVANAVDYLKPPWWTGANGANCDDTNYYQATGVHSTILTTWNGVKVCGPLPGTDGDRAVTFSYSQSEEWEWQCTELVKRYLLMAFSKPSMGNTYGYQVVNNYANAYPDTFIAVPNDGSAHAFPKVGDLVSYGNESPGHTAIITAITVTDPTNGDATLSLIEQNLSPTGTTTETVDGWVIQDTVTGWLTPVWSIQTASNPGTYNNLSAITDIASNDIWAVGSSTGNVGGVYRTYPTAYRWNGQSWGSNAIGTNYLDNLLNGVSAISSTNAVAVGSSTSSIAFAMRYNGSWSSITVDRPGSQSPLMAVSSDPSSSETWAVGYYLQSGTYRPLLERYNGSNAFIKASDPLTVTGSVETRLFGVSVLSSNDAWAVGWYKDSSNNRHPITYHYDGTNWTYQTTPEPSGSIVLPQLLAVKAIASNNVWAVGSFAYSATPGQSEPLVMHWDGSSWTVDTAPAPLLHGGFFAIDAASAGTIYATGLTGSVGSSYPRPLVIRYNGTSWAEVSVPTNFSERFNGIAVTGSTAGDAIWAVGGKISSSTYNLIEQGSVR